MIWILASYLCGSIPFGLFIARAVAGKDVREVGSGNIGATNVRRAAGRTAAAATLLLDALKGFVPVLLAPRAPAWIASACCGVMRKWGNANFGGFRNPGIPLSQCVPARTIAYHCS